MSTSSVLGLVGLIVVGVIIADFVTHPQGTSAVTKGINSIFSTSLRGLLGKT